MADGKFSAAVISDACISLTGLCIDIETVSFPLHWNWWDTSTRRTIFTLYFGRQTETPNSLPQITSPAVDQGVRKSSGNILFSLLREGAGSVGENAVGRLSWVPLTVGGLSWLALVFSWGYHQLKSFSGLIHRRIINRRLQGFPSNFLRGKPWVRFVRGLS